VAEHAKQQAEKFKVLARVLDCDEDEAAFDERLQRLATTKPRATGSWSVQMAKVGSGYIAWLTPDGYGPKAEGPHFDTEAEARAWIAEQ